MTFEKFSAGTKVQVLDSYSWTEGIIGVALKYSMQSEGISAWPAKGSVLK